MKDLIVLPTLDGSKEAAIKRLEAWSTMSTRRAMAGVARRSMWSNPGSQRSLLDLLGVEQ